MNGSIGGSNPRRDSAHIESIDPYADQNMASDENEVVTDNVVFAIDERVDNETEKEEGQKESGILASFYTGMLCTDLFGGKICLASS